jgi:hypothetical protein
MQLSSPRRRHGHGGAKPFLVALLEVLIAEVPVFDAIAEHEVGRGQNRAGDGEDGLLRLAPAFDTEELRAQIAALLAGGGRRSVDLIAFSLLPIRQKSNRALNLLKQLLM